MPTRARRRWIYLHEHPSEVVLILSDINMPGMSGLELLRHIRQEYDAPPPPAPPQVMMITAYGDEASRQQALALGANDFLTKPVDFCRPQGRNASPATSPSPMTTEDSGS